MPKYAKIVLLLFTGIPHLPIFFCIWHMAYGIWHMAYGHRTIYDKYGQVGYPLKEQYKCSSAVLLVKLDGYSMFLQASMHILASFLERKKAFFVASTHPHHMYILRGCQNSKKVVLWNQKW